MSYLKKYKLIQYAKNFKMLSTSQKYAQNLPIEVEQLGSSQMTITKRIEKPPFMKNLFIGNFDTDILAFPEVLRKEELSAMDDKLSQIKPLLNNPSQTNLKDIYSLLSAVPYDKVEMTETERCYILEHLAECRSLAFSVINHQYFGVKCISNQVNTTVHNKYFKMLSSGENISAFCLVEKELQDPSMMKTTATLTDDENFWVLNGVKLGVINGNQANVYIVVANTFENEFSPLNNDKLSVFVVEKDFGGITKTPYKINGFPELDICTVTFNNTRIPAENLIGVGSDSLKILSPLSSGIRLSSGPMSITLLRTLIHQFRDYIVNTKQGNKCLSDVDFVKNILAEININLYAIESLTYLTAGLMDKYEKQDCDLESVIVKVFSTEKCFESVQNCLRLMGSLGYEADHWIQPLYTDALGYVLLNETNDTLRMAISLLGLQFAGFNLQENVRKSRNPFYFPVYIMKKMFQERRQRQDDPKLNLELENYLHPSLIYSAQALEYCVHRLEYATETLLIQHGPKIVDQHMDLKRLSNVAIDIYAMVAVLSRSSRAYCIGLQNADYEILIANAFCISARIRVKQNVEEICRGPYGTNDVNYQKLAERALKFNGYFAEHALTYNF